MTDMDFNTADTQDSAFALIPANTLAKVCLTIRPGGAGPEGWLTQSRSSSALYLNSDPAAVDLVRGGDDPALGGLAENLGQSDHRDRTRLDDIGQDLTRADRWQLVDVADDQQCCGIWHRLQQ